MVFTIVGTMAVLLSILQIEELMEIILKGIVLVVMFGPIVWFRLVEPKEIEYLSIL